MARRQPARRRTLYASLTPRQQRDAFIRLRGKILRDKPVYGGQFSSHLVLREEGSSTPGPQWFEFVFLGCDGHTIWKAEIVTAARAFWDAVESLAFDRAYDLLTEAEREEEFRWETDQISVRGQKFYEVHPREPRHYATFDGQTFADYEDRAAGEIIIAEPPVIHEAFQTGPSYEDGIGLNVVVDAPEIDQTVIDTVIERFRSLGETDWISSEPVPRDRLPDRPHEGALETRQLVERLN